MDESEAVGAEFAGIVQAVRSADFPESLERISNVEKDSDRVRRLKNALDEKLAGSSFSTRVAQPWAYMLPMGQQRETQQIAESATAIEHTGATADAKPSAFVAMPFLKETEDTFYFGIQVPGRAVGISCERIVHAVFTGSIFDSIKQRIERAAVIIADLSTGNPNLSLEVGYAWGKGRPTILLTKDIDALPFDVSGHKCLKYTTLKELEGLLAQELQGLKSEGLI